MLWLDDGIDDPAADLFLSGDAPCRTPGNSLQVLVLESEAMVMQNHVLFVLKHITGAVAVT